MEKQKKSLRSVLFNTFFEEVPKKQDEKLPQSNAVNSQDSTNPVIPPQQPLVRKEGEVNEDYFNNLLQAIQKDDMVGNDYLEFRKTLIGMSSLGLKELQLYQAVFISLNSQDKMTKKHLLESLDYYLGDSLKKEKDAFMEDLKNARIASTGSIEEEISKSSKELEFLNQQLASIHQSIKENSDNIVKKQQELLEASTKIERAEKDFTVTMEVLTNQITSDKDKIIQYVPEDTSSADENTKKKKR